MLNQDGKISAHYVDSIGFKELPGFLDKKPERTSAEFAELEFPPD